MICDDLLLAFEKLDSSSFIPPIYCEADHLLRIPALSPGDVASVLRDTSSDVAGITTSLASHRDQVNELKQQISLSCTDMKESLISSISEPTTKVFAVKEQVSDSSASTRNQAQGHMCPMPE